MSAMTIIYQEIVLADIQRERNRQNEKWGLQEHHPLEWQSILIEEVGEVGKAINETWWSNASPKDFSDYRKELVEVAAVAVAAIEDLDRRGNP